jgi:hypothetical protein
MAKHAADIRHWQFGGGHAYKGAGPLVSPQARVNPCFVPSVSAISVYAEI